MYLLPSRRRDARPPASEALHRALGFQPVGTYRDIGFKLGVYHDVAWVQRML